MAAPSFAARPTTQEFRLNDCTPLYLVETTEGVPVVANTRMDRVVDGQIFLRSGAVRQRYAGGKSFWSARGIRAGISGLKFLPQSLPFWQRAVRGSTSDPTGTWAHNGLLASRTIYAGASDDDVALWGCKFNELRWEQRFGEDPTPPDVTAEILALGGVVGGAGAAMVQGDLGTAPIEGWMGVAAISGLASSDWIRRIGWTLRNNIQQVTRGDKQATAADRGAGASGYLREPWQLREGEEEFELELDLEVPLSFSAEAAANPALNTYQPGTITGTLTYTNPLNTSKTIIHTFSNLSLNPETGWEFAYESESIDRTPVRVYTGRFVKTDPTAAAIAFSGTAT